MASVYVDLSTHGTLQAKVDIDQGSAMASFLENLDDNSAERKFSDTGSRVSCVNKLATGLDLLFAKAKDPEVVSFFALFSTLLVKCGVNSCEEILPTIIGHITSSKEREVVRLQILGDLFNLISTLSCRFLCLNALFKYAVETNQMDAVHHQVAHLDDWIYELKLDKDQVRQLISSVFPGLHNTTESRELIIRFLQTFEKDESLGAYEETVKKLLINLMKRSNNEATEFDELLNCTVLSTLKGTPEHELLEIFANGTCQEFQEFTKKHDTLFSDNGINLDSALNSISLATFSRLCASSKLVTYSEAAKALNVPEDEVEFLVVEAVTKGLVDVRLNQPEKTITVSYARQRHYTINEWKQLGQRVDDFKANILELVTVLEEAR